MGIIEGRRLLNHNQNDISEEIHSLLEEFVTMQEDSVNILKAYL